MKIIVDAMGGDNAPQAIVEGALQAHEMSGVELLLVGQEQAILAAAETFGYQELPSGVTIVPASEIITMEDDPATAFKRKKDSSITVGLNLLKNGEGDAFVSAGSTGALLSASTLLVKRIRGIRRAALAPVIPHAAGGKFILIDCGANAECTVEYLMQFAQLGKFYAQQVLQVETPRIGLLNIGAEPNKGDALRQATYLALKEAHEAGELCFVGNVEAKEAMKGACEVLVADGFSGNVMLKTVEGVGSFLGKEVKGMFLKNTATKLASLLVRKELKQFKQNLNPDFVGGTAFLGISKPVIKVHGSTGPQAVTVAISQAQQMAESRLTEKMDAYPWKSIVSEKEA